MHDPLVALQLIYQVFSKVLGSIVLRTRSHTTKDVEILILRHQLTVLRRSTPRPRMTWTDRAVIAVLTRLLPARRLGLPVTLATVLRWHRLWGSRSRSEPVTCGDRQPGIIADVSLRLLYLIFACLVSGLMLLPRASSSKNIELVGARNSRTVADLALAAEGAGA